VARRRPGGTTRRKHLDRYPRAFRGRSLARLAKLAAIARCAENGIELLVTSNDSANAAMLAINTKLGYRPTIEHLAMTRQP
jgi:RimJ/RimL family protein N-acetyltransferase